MNEQRRQINQQPLKQEWSNCWTFQLCWTEVPYQRSRVYYFSLPRSHFLQEAHFQQFCKTNMLTWRMRQKSESKSSKLELEGSQGSCLISILPFPSNHRGRWGCWGSVMPSLSPLPPKNFRTRTSVKVNLSKTNIKILSSVVQSCPTLCDPMNHSTPGVPVHHQLPEFTQTHIHRVSDAIQPSHSLLSPSPPAPNPSQHQSLFQWVNSSHEVAKVLEFQPQHHSFQRTPRTDL